MYIIQIYKLLELENASSIDLLKKKVTSWALQGPICIWAFIISKIFLRHWNHHQEFMFGRNAKIKAVHFVFFSFPLRWFHGNSFPK